MARHRQSSVTFLANNDCNQLLDSDMLCWCQTVFFSLINAGLTCWYSFLFQVWNSVGMIRSYASEEDSTVDIEFHDAAVHHAIHLSNTENYIMADIGETAILLGSRENSQRRRFVFHGFCSHPP